MGAVRTVGDVQVAVVGTDAADADNSTENVNLFGVFTFRKLPCRCKRFRYGVGIFFRAGVGNDGAFGRNGDGERLGIGFFAAGDGCRKSYGCVLCAADHRCGSAVYGYCRAFGNSPADCGAVSARHRQSEVFGVGFFKLQRRFVRRYLFGIGGFRHGAVESCGELAYADNAGIFNAIHLTCTDSIVVAVSSQIVVAVAESGNKHVSFRFPRPIEGGGAKLHVGVSAALFNVQILRGAVRIHKGQGVFARRAAVGNGYVNSFVDVGAGAIVETIHYAGEVESFFAVVLLDDQLEGSRLRNGDYLLSRSRFAAVVGFDNYGVVQGLAVDGGGDNYRCVLFAAGNGGVEPVDSNRGAVLNNVGCALGQGEVFRYRLGNFEVEQRYVFQFVGGSRGNCRKYAAAVKLDFALVVGKVARYGDLVARLDGGSLFARHAEAFDEFVHLAVHNDGDGDVFVLLAVSVVHADNNAGKRHIGKRFALEKVIRRVHYVHHHMYGERLGFGNVPAGHGSRENCSGAGGRHCNSKVSAVYNNCRIVGRPRNGNVGVRRACHGKSGCAVFRVGEFVYFQGCKFGVNLFLVGVGDVVGFREADFDRFEVEAVGLDNLGQFEVGVVGTVGSDNVVVSVRNGAEHLGFGVGTVGGAEFKLECVGVVVDGHGVGKGYHYLRDTCVERFVVFDGGNGFVLDTHLNTVAVVAQFGVGEGNSVYVYGAVLIRAGLELHAVYGEFDHVVVGKFVLFDGYEVVAGKGFAVVGDGCGKSDSDVFVAAVNLSRVAFDGERFFARRYRPRHVFVLIQFEVYVGAHGRINYVVADNLCSEHYGADTEEVYRFVNYRFAVFDGVGGFYVDLFLVGGRNYLKGIAAFQRECGQLRAKLVGYGNVAGGGGQGEGGFGGDALVCACFGKSTLHCFHCCGNFRAGILRAVGIFGAAGRQVVNGAKVYLMVVVVAAKNTRYGDDVACLYGVDKRAQRFPLGVACCGGIFAGKVL